MNSAIATVNGEDITRTALEAAVARYIIQLQQENTEFSPEPEQMKFIHTETLNQLIERALLLQKARAEGVTVPHEAVHQAIVQMKGNFETEEDWKDNLQMLHIPEDNLFGEIEKDMLLERFLQKQYASLPTYTDSDLEAYFKENERFMKEPDLFSFYETYADNTEQIKLIHEVYTQEKETAGVKQKMDVLKMHFHSHSDIPAYQLPEETLNVLSDLETGKIASMPAPDGGFLVYRLNERAIGRKLDYPSIKDKLNEYLVRTAKNETFDRLLAGELEKAAIEYKDPDFIKKK